MTLLQSRPVTLPAGIQTIEDWQGWLRQQLVESYERYARLFPQRLAVLGIPPVDVWWQTPDSGRGRPVLLHGDLHPENLLLVGSDVWILDWEIALVGDPIWEAATAVHRTRWPDEAAEQQAAARFLATVSRAAEADDAEQVFAFCQDVELWRSLIVDSERYPELIAANPTAEEIEYRARSFWGKLRRGHERFGCAEVSLGGVRGLVVGWAAETSS